MKFYYIISLFVILISTLYKKADAAIHKTRTSSIGKTRAINRTRKPQSKPHFKKPDTSKAPQKTEKKTEHTTENKNHETNKKESHNDKTETNKKELVNDKKESNHQLNSNNNDNRKEDPAKTNPNVIHNPTQNNFIQNPIQTNNNNLPIVNAPQVENKESSGFASGILSSIGGNIIGNGISEKLFKSEKHEKHESKL